MDIYTIPAIENIDTVIVAIGAAICFLLLLMATTLWRQNSLMKKQLESMQAHHQSVREAIESLSEKTQQLATEYRQLQTDLALNELYTGSSDMYLQAINAAKSGASAVEIAEQYGMISSEAELITSIHGARSAA